MNKFFHDIKESFQSGNFLTKLIYINAGVFVIASVALVLCDWFDVSTYWIQYVELPAFGLSLLRQPWSLITYMFLHTNFAHVIFNLIALYYFGQLFLQFFSQKQLVAAYIWGGIAGAIGYLGAFTLLPHLAPYKLVSYLLGASASIMAILFAAVAYAPNQTVQVTLIGPVKLKYIGFVFLALDLLGLGAINSGGSISHLGGALMGYIFTICLQKGNDISLPITNLIDWVVDHWPTRSKSKIKVTVNNTQNMSDAQWNQQQKQQAQYRQERIDQILDKIKKTGYQNLSDEEKKSLFDLSKDQK